MFEEMYFAFGNHNIKYFVKRTSVLHRNFSVVFSNWNKRSLDTNTGDCLDFGILIKFYGALYK